MGDSVTFYFLIVAVGLKRFSGGNSLRCCLVSLHVFLILKNGHVEESLPSRRIIQITIIRHSAAFHSLLNSVFKHSFQQFKKLFIPFESFARQFVSAFISPSSCYSSIYHTSTRSSRLTNTFCCDRHFVPRQHLQTLSTPEVRKTNFCQTKKIICHCVLANKPTT